MKRILPCAVALVVAGATISSAQDREPQLIESSRLLVEGGGRVDFGPRGELLAFDKPDADGRHDIFVLDLETFGERCISCKVYDLRKSSNFNPAWQPSGDHVVFQSQTSPRRLRIDALEMTTPNRGVHSDLWIMRTDAKDFYRLTRAAEAGSAVLDPHFSYEGDRLIWTERATSRGRGFGEWRLQNATLKTRRGIAALKKSRKYVPGKGVMIAHGFSPDERSVLLSGNLNSQSERGTDVYLLDLETEDLTRLTHTSRSRESIAHFTANGRQILFTAERPIDPLLEREASNQQLLLPGTEIWLMNLDGTDKRQVTTFFDDHGRVTIGDFSVSPDGTNVAVQLVFGGEEPRQAIYLLRTAPELHR
ncbi:MAG: hypothetical protein AAF690_16515 [Acidobacteriota bacterium]